MEIAKALEIITGKVDNVLLNKGYEKHSVADTDNEKTVLYTGDVAYSIVYYFDKKRIVLRSCSVTDGEPDNAWKTAATWLFDEEVDGAREAENIGDDFADTRGVTFAETKILPLLQAYAKREGDKNMEKLSKALSDLYDAGDLDVKGIITYVLLNGIDDDAQYEKLTATFTKEQKKIANASRNLRGKKMKPEKPKKPKKYIADRLQSMNNVKR